MKKLSKLVPLKSGFHIWTRRVGSGPTPIILVHGGPGMSHEYLDCFIQEFDLNKYSLYFYDQLGSYYSDHPNDKFLWRFSGFCDEIESIRKYWHIEKFVLYGQSWGGMVAMEYALKYTSNLLGLIISNMVDDISKYRNRLYEIRDSFGSDASHFISLCEHNNDIKNSNYRLYVDQMYENFFCRVKPWPEFLIKSLKHTNFMVLKEIFGLKEFDITGNVRNWSIEHKMANLEIPILFLSAKYDTVNPRDIIKMSEYIQSSSVFICPNGSHLSMYDDRKNYFGAINSWLARIK